MVVVQRKTIACNNYGIAVRLHGFIVSGDLGLGHVDAMPFPIHSCQKARELSYFLPGGFMVLFTWPV